MTLPTLLVALLIHEPLDLPDAFCGVERESDFGKLVELLGTIDSLACTFGRANRPLSALGTNFFDPPVVGAGRWKLLGVSTCEGCTRVLLMRGIGISAFRVGWLNRQSLAT